MEKKYLRNKDWKLEKVLNGTSAVLLPSISQRIDLTKIVQLNHTGILIWEQLDQAPTVSELSEKIKVEFQLGQAPTQEVQTFLQDALNIGAVYQEKP